MPGYNQTPGLNTLADCHYAAGDFTRKAPSYLLEYERLLEGSRDKQVRVLELGVSSGASLLLWRDYLPNGIIVGVDVDAMPAKIANQERVHFIRASQDDSAALDKAAEIAGGPFDLIVDDASHLGYLTKRSFMYLFPNLLKPGGTYVIEDFGTGFLPEYPDGSSFVEPVTDDMTSQTKVFASHQFGMVGVVKQLIDHMMQELMTGNRSYLSIARMTILTNIALIEKSPLPPGPRPDPGPLDLDASQGESAAETTADLAAHVRRLDARVSELEGVLGRLLNRLKPLRALRRFLR
jgi:SAM-dependent methyltransferase